MFVKTESKEKLCKNKIIIKNDIPSRAFTYYTRSVHKYESNKFVFKYYQVYS